MALTDFKIQFQLQKIYEKLNEEDKQHLAKRLKCGTWSVFSILEFFELDYDMEKFIIDSNDGNAVDTGKTHDGSTILDITYALVNTGLVDVELYLANETEAPKSEEEKMQEKKDNILRQKIITISNEIIKPPITIDQVLEKTNNESIPIIGFHRKGDLENPHFSPLRGINGPILMFSLDIETSGDCNVEKNEFIETWWTRERDYLGVIIVKKKKLNEWNLLAKVNEHLQNNTNIEFKIESGFIGQSWSGIVRDSGNKCYVIDDQNKDALWEAMVTRGWSYGLEIKGIHRFINFSRADR